MACIYLYSQDDLLFHFQLTRIWLYYDMYRVSADRFMLNCSIFYVYFGCREPSTTQHLKWKRLIFAFEFNNFWDVFTSIKCKNKLQQREALKKVWKFSTKGGGLLGPFHTFCLKLEGVFLGCAHIFSFLSRIFWDKYPLYCL